VCGNRYCKTVNRASIKPELVAAENAAAASDDNQKDEQYENKSNVVVTAENS